MIVHCVTWLTTVIIASDLHVWSLFRGHAPWLAHMPMLAMSCKSHPSVKVRYQFIDFEFEEERSNSSLRLIQMGVALTIALKGEKNGRDAVDALLSWLPRAWDDYELARNWRETWNIEYLMKGVKNFAFWPRMNSMYAQDGQARFRRLRDDANELMLPDPHTIIKWLSYTKVWCEDGTSCTA